MAETQVDVLSQQMTEIVAETKTRSLLTFERWSRSVILYEMH